MSPDSLHEELSTWLTRFPPEETERPYYKQLITQERAVENGYRYDPGTIPSVPVTSDGDKR